MGIKKFIIKNELGVVLQSKSFKDLTTMKVGGKIKCLYYPNTVNNLIIVLKRLKKQKRNFFIIGNGSNVIASDNVYRRVVISGKHLINDIAFNEDYFIASAFMDLRKINAKLIENKISTLINLSGIPATLGGAIVMNAGAFKSHISDNLLWVKYIEDTTIKIKNKDEINFGYRESEFKGKNIIILEAAFKIILNENVIFLNQEILEKRKSIHPLDYPNSGSIFKNGSSFKAYEIIRKINLVDYKIGHATFSNKHANFIVNLKNAKAKDVYNLIILAKKRALIFEKVALTEEVVLLNFWSYRFFKRYLKN